MREIDGFPIESSRHIQYVLENSLALRKLILSHWGDRDNAKGVGQAGTVCYKWYGII